MCRFTGVPADAPRGWGGWLFLRTSWSEIITKPSECKCKADALPAFDGAPEEGAHVSGRPLRFELQVVEAVRAASSRMYRERRPVGVGCIVKEMCWSQPAGVFNVDLYDLRHGDPIVFGGGTWGHVAVVDK